MLEETRRKERRIAKLVISDNAVDIHFSLLERVVLSERSRTLPLSRIRAVDPHPPLHEMMSHWSDQRGSLICGVSLYDGQMVPSARHPESTLAILLEGDEQERIFFEVDDESPREAAGRIERARNATQQSQDAPALAITSHASAGASEHAAQQAALYEALDLELEEEELGRRDPLMQGSLPPGAMLRAEPAREHALDAPDLSRLSSWLLGLGSLALLGGGVMITTGALPGLLAVGAGVAAALLGGVALAVVARHQE